MHKGVIWECEGSNMMSIISPNNIALDIDCTYVQHHISHFTIVQPCNPANHPCAILGSCFLRGRYEVGEGYMPGGDGGPRVLMACVH